MRRLSVLAAVASLLAACETPPRRPPRSGAPEQAVPSAQSAAGPEVAAAEVTEPDVKPDRAGEPGAGAGAPAEKAPSRDEQEIRSLIPAAASAPGDFGDYITRTGRVSPKVYEQNGHNLTSVLFASVLASHTTSTLQYHIDFRVEPDVPVKKIVSGLVRWGIFSVIYPQDITEFECDVKGDAAEGKVAFEAKGVWRGTVGFRAERRGGKWRVTEFRLLPRRGETGSPPSATRFTGRAIRLVSARGTRFHPRLREYWKIDRPCDRLLVKMEEDGTTWILDPLGIHGMDRKVTAEELEVSLKAVASASPRDEAGRPAGAVVIDPHLSLSYSDVGKVVNACVQAQLRHICFEMAHLRDLPEVFRRFEVQGIELVEETPPPFGHESNFEEPAFPLILRDESGVGGPPPGPRRPEPRESKRPATGEEGGPARGPEEIRVRIYWANADGQVIHAPDSAYPEDWPHARGRLSTKGAHVEIKVNQTKVTAGYHGPSFDELARTLESLAAMDPDMPVVIDARRKVPFKSVFGALTACRRAKAKKVVFQAPPAPGADGPGWWWY